MKVRVFTWRSVATALRDSTDRLRRPAHCSVLFPLNSREMHRKYKVFKFKHVTQGVHARKQDVTKIELKGFTLRRSVECAAEHDVVLRNLIATIKRKYLSIPRLTEAVCLAAGQVFMSVCVWKINTTSRENGDPVVTFSPCLTSYHACRMHNNLTYVKPAVFYIQGVDLFHNSFHVARISTQQTRLRAKLSGSFMRKSCGREVVPCYLIKEGL